MKYVFRIIIFILIMGVASVLPAQGDTLTILHINDTHSNLAPLGPRTVTLEGTQGGIARAASVIGMTKMADPNVLVLHAGDVFIGDLFFNCFFGVAELQLMLAMGFDAMAVGNHEFDLTPAALEEALDSSFVEGSFPLLSANTILEHPDVSGLKEYIFPFTVKEFDSIKVGIFGLTTPETNVLSQPYPAFIDTNFVEAAGAMVDTLTKLDCDVIICLSHLGYLYDQLVVSYVPGINIIVGGHDHFIFEEPEEVTDPLGNTTYIVQADAFYSNMGKAQLVVEDGEVSLLDYALIPLDENIQEEPTTKATVDYLISEIEATYGPVYTQQVGYCDEYFEEVADSLLEFGPHDTPIGNLVTDAYRSTFGTDIAIQAGGSTAQPLYDGPIVGADLFRVVGYGFNTDNGLGYRMATFDLTGTALIYGLIFGLSDIENTGDEYLIQVSGMTYKYNSGEPDNLLDLAETYVGGELIVEDSVYSVAANEFVPMFLDFAEIPYSNLHVYSDTTEFEVLTEYVKSLGDTLHLSDFYSIKNSRIHNDVYIGIENADPLPASFTLEQNYPNPFNPSTRIPFTLDRTCHIELNVYDITGRKVKMVHSGVLPAGRHNLLWDGTNVGGRKVASGIYLYRLNNGSKNETRKMVMLR